MPTLTTYPVAGANDPVDAPVNLVGQDATFSTLSNGNGNQGGLETSSTDHLAKTQASTTSNQFQTICRGIYVFDTSSIGTTDSISSAILSLYIFFKENSLGDSGVTIVSASPAANNAVAASDYQTVGTTSFGSATYAGVDTGGNYTNFTLNASGIANVAKGSGARSKFASQLTWDFDDSFGGVWVSNAETRHLGNFADETGTTKDPKLVVEYTSGAGNIAWLTA